MAEKFVKLTAAAALVLLCCACSRDVIRPAIVPGVEVRMPENEPKKEVKKPENAPLKIIGAVEPVYFLRDGEKWVAFDLNNRETGEKYHFEKRIERRPTIKRIHTSEERIVVEMDVKMGDEIIKAEFSLAHRDRFNYQGLIGRNILAGRALVDTSLVNTLR